MSKGNLTLKSVFSLFFSFKGRIKRKPFIYGIILGALFVWICFFPVLIFEKKSEEMNFIFMGIFAIFFIYCVPVLTIKRLRDCNHPLLLCLLSYVSPINSSFYFKKIIFAKPQRVKNLQFCCFSSSCGKNNEFYIICQKCCKLD